MLAARPVGRHHRPNVLSKISLLFLILWSVSTLLPSSLSPMSSLLPPPTSCPFNVRFPPFRLYLAELSGPNFVSYLCTDYFFPRPNQPNTPSSFPSCSSPSLFLREHPWAQPHQRGKSHNNNNAYDPPPRMVFPTNLGPRTIRPASLRFLFGWVFK